jgi:hypothetical protein
VRLFCREYRRILQFIGGAGNSEKVKEAPHEIVDQSLELRIPAQNCFSLPGFGLRHQLKQIDS